MFVVVVGTTTLADDSLTPGVAAVILVYLNARGNSVCSYLQLSFAFGLVAVGTIVETVEVACVAVAVETNSS